MKQKGFALASILMLVGGFVVHQARAQEQFTLILRLQ